MPTTGAELGRELDLIVDKPYTGFFDAAKKNRLFLMAFINLTEKKYNSLDRQQVYDELTHFLKTGVEHTVRNGRVYTKPLQIASVSIAVNDVGIVTYLPHDLAVNDSVTISDAQGVAGLNVTAGVVSVVSPTEFRVNIAGATGAYVPNSGKFVSPIMLPDYHHLLSVECVYEDVSKYANVRIECAEGNPATIRLNRPVDIRTGDRITISGVTGNTAVNGTWYVRKVGLERYKLYVDSDFQVPVVSNQAYNSGGLVRREVRNYAMPYVSDQKISSFGTASVSYPKFEISEGFLKLEPAPVKIVIDYMTEGAVIPTVRIDVSDNVTDLELYYPKKFLVRLVNEAADLQHLAMRDLSQYQAQTQETIENP